MDKVLVSDLLFRLADDELIIGHRNSEWTGLGPVLEEDIAFASMAQDEIGHSQSYYLLLEELGFGDPDKLAFFRQEKDFRSCHLVELPIGDYAFSLIRHLLYDFAEEIRLRALLKSTYEPLRLLAHKLLREEKYHVLHAKTWVSQLAKGSEESRLRLQSALNETYPLAFGIFEPTEHDSAIHDAGICPSERHLAKLWVEHLTEFLKPTGLILQNAEEIDVTVGYGGRKGYHSEYLAPLLKEMTEVITLEPTAVW